MAKHSAVMATLTTARSSRSSPLTERLNSQVLKTLRDLATSPEEECDASEYEEEMFVEVSVVTSLQKKKAR